MRKIRLHFYAILVITLFLSFKGMAQDTLPNFTIHQLTKEKKQISWINPYSNCIQLVVQRSYDSTKLFTSIYSAQSPALPQNGFVDNVSSSRKVFYRIFYVLEDGKYFFTKSKSSLPSNTSNITDAGNIAVNNDMMNNKPAEKRFINIYNSSRDSLLLVLEEADFKKFRDSISRKTKDTLVASGLDEVMLKKFVAKPSWKPSQFIFTNIKGFVTIALSNTKLHKYRIVFFEESGKELFQIKQVKEDNLVLDKADFLHAGWFHFELYEDDKLKEKNKFYLEKEF
ncbi:MAG: hypothetical protein KGO81_01885 [Bacteroidota bacterium]|nr:hypothetical protein [Bacteroidota bacterium]